MSEYVYALDLALGNSGVTIYDLSNQEVVYIGSVNTEKIKKKKDLYHNAIKLKHIYNEIADLREKYPPSVVAIERGFSRYNASTQVIYRVHGLINYLFYDMNQLYYPPKMVKETVVHGNATKEDLQIAINLKYPQFTFKNEDESDSFAVLLTYLIKNNLIDWEKPKLSEIHKIKKLRKSKK